MAVDEHIAHGEVLRQTDQSVVNGSVTVRMITAQYGTDGVGAFSVCLFGIKIVFKHCVKYAPVNGFKSVPDIGQSTLHDNAHRIIKKGISHFLVYFNINDFLIVVANYFISHLLSLLCGIIS